VVSESRVTWAIAAVEEGEIGTVSESRVTWAIAHVTRDSDTVPMLVFLGLSVLDLGPTYATDRRQTASSLNAIRGRA